MESLRETDAALPEDQETEAIEAHREALRDVYGTYNVKSFEQGEAMLASARKHVEEALQLLPNKDGLRDAYDEAMKNCPHLVEMESNPILFLKAADYDPWAAAKNTALYWQLRLEIFGPERAFLPMIMSGKGALSEDVLDAFMCGGAIILPPDNNKRPIYYTDRSRCCAKCQDQDYRARICFYLLQSLLESDDALKYGFLAMVILDTNDAAKEINKPGPKLLKLLKLDAIPLTIRAFHLIVLRKRSFIESSVPLWLHLLGRWKFITLRTVVHYAENKETAMADLKSYGLLEENTPASVGGTLDHDEEFARWRKNRAEIEQKRYASILAVVATSTTTTLNQRNGQLKDDGEDRAEQETAAAKEGTAVGGPRPPRAAALDDLAAAAEQARAEEARARKRKLDAIYQRNKREHERQSIGRLKEQVNGLYKENSALKAEHTSLKISMERALSAVENHEREQQQRALATLLGRTPVAGGSRAVVPREQPAPQDQEPSSILSQLLRVFPLGTTAPPASNNTRMINEQDVNLAMLRRLHSTDGMNLASQQRSLAQQLQAQQMLLRQQLQQQQLLQQQQQRAQLAEVLWAGRSGAPPATLFAPSMLPSQQRQQQQPRAIGMELQQQQEEEDLIESILRRHRN